MMQEIPSKTTMLSLFTERILFALPLFWAINTVAKDTIALAEKTKNTCKPGIIAIWGD